MQAEPLSAADGRALVARARGWARAARQRPTHLMPARERVASSADLSAPRLAPLGAETQAQHVNATSTAQAKAWRPRRGGDGTDCRVSFGHTSAGVEQVSRYGRSIAAERLR